MNIYHRLQVHNGVVLLNKHKTPQIRWQSTVQGFLVFFTNILRLKQIVTLNEAESKTISHQNVEQGNHKL